MIYIAQVVAYTGLLWAVYALLLRDRPIHRFNRTYLLLSTILPFAIPFITLPQQTYSRVANITDLGVQLPEIVVGQALKPQTEAATDWLLVAYVAVALALLVVMAVRWLKLYRVIKRSKAIPQLGYTLLMHTKYGPGSWGKYIFLPEGMVDDTIIKHELAHIQLKHTADVIWISLLQCLCWPNFFLHLLKKELKQLHEYQADVIACNDKTAYQELLVASLFNTCTLPFTHSFIIHPIKRRIKMLNKKINPNKNRVAILAAFTITIAVAFNVVALQSCKGKNWEVKEEKSDALTVADKMPAFNGNLQQYLMEHVKYPEDAQKKNIQGRVVVQFVVGVDGSITNAKLLTETFIGGAKVDDIVAASNSGILANEALRVVRSMPKWIPGENKGKKVPVLFTMPFSFTLGEATDWKPGDPVPAPSTANKLDNNIPEEAKNAVPSINKEALKSRLEAQELANKIAVIAKNDGVIPMRGDGQIDIQELDAELKRVTKNRE